MSQWEMCLGERLIFYCVLNVQYSVLKYVWKEVYEFNFWIEFLDGY